MCRAASAVHGYIAIVVSESKHDASMAKSSGHAADGTTAGASGAGGTSAEHQKSRQKDEKLKFEQECKLAKVRIRVTWLYDMILRSFVW